MLRVFHFIFQQVEYAMYLFLKFFKLGIFYKKRNKDM